MFKLPKIPNKKHLEFFFQNKNLKDLVILSKKKSLKTNQLFSTIPYKPELIDL